MTLHLPGYFLFYLQCFAFSTFATIQENFVSFRKFNKKFKTKMAAKHFFVEGLVAKFWAHLVKNTRFSKKSPLKTIVSYYS